MHRFFSSSTTRLLRWIGYDINMLPPVWQAAAKTYANNGAVSRVGEIDTIEILHRPNKGPSPVHKSAFNPSDTADVISARITPKDGGPTLTHHIYQDGTGTTKKGDERK